jgi:thiazole synthase ThiGH ThiG subunit
MAIRTHVAELVELGPLPDANLLRTSLAAVQGLQATAAVVAAAVGAGQSARAAGREPRDLHAEAVTARDALAGELATQRHPPAN